MLPDTGIGADTEKVRFQQTSWKFAGERLVDGSLLLLVM